MVKKAHGQVVGIFFLEATKSIFVDPHRISDLVDRFGLVVLPLLEHGGHPVA
jgi:hypothetical protein